MAMPNIFNSDAFSLTSMVAAVNDVPFVPGRIGRLGIFEEEGITTTTVAIERDGDTLALIPVKERGAPPWQNKSGKRTLRNLTVPHLPLEDQIMASEIQNVRAFGSSQLQTVEQVRNKKLRQMTAKHDATVEYQRVGAVKGIILDADGATTIYNLFTEFGVTQDTVDFVLGTSTTNILGKVQQVLEYIEDALGGLPNAGVHAIVGRTWWSKFISHPEVREAYKYFQAAGQRFNPLREDLRTVGFEFGGITFEVYRGKVGSVNFVADSEAHFFPLGVPGMYRTVYAPADFIETANTPGLPRYAKTERMEYDRGIKILTESNPLSFVTRPKALVKGTTSN